MGIADRIMDSLAAVIKMNDKVERIASKQVDLSKQHEALKERVITLSERIVRLETALEISMMMAGKVGQVKIEQKK